MCVHIWKTRAAIDVPAELITNTCTVLYSVLQNDILHTVEIKVDAPPADGETANPEITASGDHAVQLVNTICCIKIYNISRDLNMIIMSNNTCANITITFGH